MIKLHIVQPLTQLEGCPARVQTVANEVLDIEEVFRQCAAIRALGYTWGVGLSEEYPPVVFVVGEDDRIEILGYAPHLCGPVIRMGVDAHDIHLVIHSPEGDELYYRLSRTDLSFDNPRGETVTTAHKELLYAAG